VVVGDGPRMGEVRERVAAAGVASRFRFVGSVPWAEVPSALADVDVGVIPDVFDYAFPVKLVEFGAAGLAVVAPRSPSLDAQIEPGVEYQPFVRGDPAALRDALLAVTRDSVRRDALAARLHAAVRERFTWSATADAVAGVVARVIERRA
jgi:glycosyltransferase involved in cell wall biosynthesis